MPQGSQRFRDSAPPLLVSHRFNQVDAPHHRFTHRSYRTHRQRTHQMQRVPSLLRKVYSGFNVGRILAGSLQPILLGLAHPLPKDSSPERQEPTLRMAEQFHVKLCHLLSAAPYTIRNRTDATAIIRRHSPRGGVLRRAAYEATCSRREQRPCVACRLPSQVCWFPQSPLPMFHVKLRLIPSTPDWTADRHRMS